MTKESSDLHPSAITPQRSTTDAERLDALNKLYSSSKIPTFAKQQAFAAWSSRQDISRFLARYEIFQQALNVNGSIVECGSFAGAGSFSWYQFSTILEPYNHSRKIFCFDTFAGFPDTTDQDHFGENYNKEQSTKGGLFLSNDTLETLEKLKSIHDTNRPISHLEKIFFIQGDAEKTIPVFLEKSPEVIVSLLYLDFDIFEPTMAALEAFYPLVPTGGLVVFDELNHPGWPGETTALKKYFGKIPRLQRSPLDPYISWFVKE